MHSSLGNKSESLSQKKKKERRKRDEEVRSTQLGEGLVKEGKAAEESKNPARFLGFIAGWVVMSVTTGLEVGHAGRSNSVWIY